MSQLFVILSAGEGSRLRPLTQSVPKALVEFKERKIIQRTLESCRLNGINDNQIIIITGHGADNFSSFSLPSVHNPIFYKSNMFFHFFLQEILTNLIQFMYVTVILFLIQTCLAS